MSASRLILLVSVLAIAGPRAVSAAPAAPRLVEVSLGPGHAAESLLSAGLDVVSLGPGRATLLEWPGDAARLAALGMQVRVLDPNPGRSAALRSAAELVSPRGAESGARAARALSPPPVGAGSMGGFWTTPEIKMKLDALVAGDTHDVVADRIDTLGYSWQGRPIWGLRLGKHVTGPDSRPAVFLNALTHAREPEGMQALFYFVDDLLARYGSDPFATYLLDHRSIYIVPLVNPDGYQFNEDYFADTGTLGFWRKNMRDNNEDGYFSIGNDGVDLNRNYGYQWGFNDVGSSPDWFSNNYRGPAPFSEPETQVERDLIATLAPRTALSFHSFSDVVLHAWSWTGVPTPDAARFREWDDELTRDNAYQSGAGATVLYEANGAFEDWCYGDTTLKPRVYSWTAEVGSSDDGFWPPPSRIVPLAAEHLRTCYVTTAIAGPFVQEDGVEIVEGAMNAGHASRLVVRAHNLGLGATAAAVVGTLAPLDAGVHLVTAAVSYPQIDPLARVAPEAGQRFQLAVDDTVTPGRPIRFRIDFTDSGGLFSRDTFVVAVGTPTVVAFDDASGGLAKWSPGSWGILAGDGDHPSPYFADSPAGPYANNANNTMLLTAPLDLSAGVHADALYEARWDLERDADGAVIEASLDGFNWVRLSATGTTPGSGLGIQTAGLPFYAGTRATWKTERADLSAFTGPAGGAVRLRFRLLSDGQGQYDGFAFDSIRVRVYDPALQPAPVAVADPVKPGSLGLAAPRPNPVRGAARFELALPGDGPARLEIFDLAGRRVATLMSGAYPAGRYVREWDGRDGARRVAPGIYLARLVTRSGAVARRFVVLG